MINKIKEDIEKNKGKILRFRHNGTRNQKEEFKGIIIDTYNYVFTVKTMDDNAKIRSYTYSDVLIDNLEIYN